MPRIALVENEASRLVLQMEPPVCIITSAHACREHNVRLRTLLRSRGTHTWNAYAAHTLGTRTRPTAANSASAKCKMAFTTLISGCGTLKLGGVVKKARA